MLVSAGEIAALLIHGLAPDVVFLLHAQRVVMDGFLFQVQSVSIGKTGLFRAFQHQIVLHGHIADEAHFIAVLGNVGHVFQNKAVGGKAGHGGALQVHNTLLRREHAGDNLGKLALAVAVHACDAHDFAPAHGQGHVVQSVVLGGLVEAHMGQLHHGLARFFNFFIAGGSKVSANHQVCELAAIRSAAVQRAYCLSRPQHRDPVGNLHHLAHFVADKNNALVLAFQLFDDGKQALGFDVGEGGGGLVQHQKLCAPVQRLEDFHPLLRAHGDFGDGLVQLHVQPIALRQLQNFLAPGILVDEQARCPPVAQNDVLKNRHCLHQHEVLVNHANALFYRLGGRGNFHRLPIQIDFSGGGLIEAKQHVHQRTLPSAVFAQKCVHLAATNIQIDVPVGIDAAELLGNVFHAQKFFHWHLPQS